MAVRIDIEAFRQSLPPVVKEAAERLRDDDLIGELDPVGGGVQAPVHAPSGAFQSWVGIVDGAVTGRCTCTAAGEDLCAHTTAVMLAAVTDDMPFSAAATPPPHSEPGSPERAAYVEAVRRLGPDQLTELVVTHALHNSEFAIQLLNEADMPDPAALT